MRRRNQTEAEGNPKRIRRTRLRLLMGILLALGGPHVTVAAQGLSIAIDGSLGPFVIGAPIQIGLSAAGGIEPYHFSLTPGAAEIPGLGVLNEPRPPFSFQAVYAGIALAGGAYAISVRVTDAIGQTSDRVITVTIVSSNIVSQFRLPNATVGVPYSFTLTMFPTVPPVRTRNGVPNQVNAWFVVGWT